MSRFWIISLFTALFLTHAQAQMRVFTVKNTLPIAEVPVTLSPTGDYHKIELRNFPEDAAPVVHLLDGRSQQIAVATATGGQVMLSLDRSLTGQFIVVVRSQTATNVQTADLWVDGALQAAKVQFTSGTSFLMSRLSPTEQVIGIRPPLGPEVHSAYLMTADGLQIMRRGAGNFTTLIAPALQDMLAVFGSSSPDILGPLNVYRNDAPKDDDGDGLGNNLELALETCPSKSVSVVGVLCNELADPRDTDGDGLSDGWEVLGRPASWVVNGVTYRQRVPLPEWGSNPRHKDIFIEVDYRRLNLQENQSNVQLKMQPAVARKMAATYSDSATTDLFRRAAHALSVNNPDRLPGISLHLDTGMDPVEPADLGIYGNWGGHNAVDAVQDAQGNWVPQKAEQVWKQQMGRARWGVFHYVLGYIGGGGQAGYGSIALGFNMDSSSNASHEFGHTLNLGHSGPAGTDEPNCKPNYPSVMNYAYQYLEQFSDGLGFPAFNNHAMKETNAISASNNSFLDVLEDKFRYTVDRSTGSVDWNRDGMFAPAGSMVRAYANYQPGNSCEFTRVGSQFARLWSERSPAVVRHKNLVWVFAVGLHRDGTYSRTTAPWICSPSIDNCPTPVFTSLQGFDAGPFQSIDAKPMMINGVERIVVAGIRWDGSLFETTVTLDNSGTPVWTPVVTISSASTAAGELSLAVSHNLSSIGMVYKAPNNTVRYRSRSASGWSAEKQLTSGGQPIVVHPNTSPGLASTYLPVNNCALCESLVGAFTDPYGFIQLYSPQGLGQGWSQIPIPYDSMYSTVGRPSLAWVPKSASMPWVGRLYMLYLEEGSVPYITPANPVRMVMSYANSSGQLRIGLDSFFDNVWAFTHGTGLMQPSDGALRAVMSSGIPNSVTNVDFRPHADGITDMTYSNYDDWKTLGWASCSTVRPHQESQQVQCAPPW